MTSTKYMNPEKNRNQTDYSERKLPITHYLNKKSDSSSAREVMKKAKERMALKDAIDAKSLYYQRNIKKSLDEKIPYGKKRRPSGYDPLGRYWPREEILARQNKWKGYKARQELQKIINKN